MHRLFSTESDALAVAKPDETVVRCVVNDRHSFRLGKWSEVCQFAVDTSDVTVHELWNFVDRHVGYRMFVDFDDVVDVKPSNEKEEETLEELCRCLSIGYVDIMRCKSSTHCGTIKPEAVYVHVLNASRLLPTGSYKRSYHVIVDGPIVFSSVSDSLCALAWSFRDVTANWISKVDIQPYYNGSLRIPQSGATSCLLRYHGCYQGKWMATTGNRLSVTGMQRCMVTVHINEYTRQLKDTNNGCTRVALLTPCEEFGTCLTALWQNYTTFPLHTRQKGVVSNQAVNYNTVAVRAIASELVKRDVKSIKACSKEPNVFFAEVYGKLCPRKGSKHSKSTVFAVIRNRQGLSARWGCFSPKCGNGTLPIDTPDLAVWRRWCVAINDVDPIFKAELVFSRDQLWEDAERLQSDIEAVWPSYESGLRVCTVVGCRIQWTANIELIPHDKAIVKTMSAREWKHHIALCKRDGMYATVYNQADLECQNDRWKKADVLLRCLTVATNCHLRGGVGNWWSAPPNADKLAEFVDHTLSTWKADDILTRSPDRDAAARECILEINCSVDRKLTAALRVIWSVTSPAKHNTFVLHPRRQRQHYTSLKSLLKYRFGEAEATTPINLRVDILHPHLLNTIAAFWICDALLNKLPVHVNLSKVFIPVSNRNAPPGHLGAPFLQRSNDWPQREMWFHADTMQTLQHQQRVAFCPKGPEQLEHEFPQLHDTIRTASKAKELELYVAPGVEHVPFLGTVGPRTIVTRAHFLDSPGRRPVCVLCNATDNTHTILRQIQTIVADATHQVAILVIRPFRKRQRDDEGVA